ncbi:MAG: uncharacterized protein KVP18_001358 [Porospora cf. gigantea A]|uniref:uncharacterized protein n=1 Tax=Porospora cf. gigantea A TaxID=2853593 RepID=UPI003559EE28|nr:MAG: hypothetical protein KVP18_001358 [Porospora cf. gigantea A]
MCIPDAPIGTAAAQAVVLAHALSRTLLGQVALVALGEAVRDEGVVLQAAGSGSRTVFCFLQGGQFVGRGDFKFVLRSENDVEDDTCQLAVSVILTSQDLMHDLSTVKCDLAGAVESVGFVWDACIEVCS